jgi:hypothetical protein
MTGRIKLMHDFAQVICPEPIHEALISEYINSEGIREYGSLWLFSTSYCCEAKNFVAQDNFDIVLLRERVSRVEFSFEEYNWKIATEKSRLTAHFYMTDSIVAQFQASGNNCDFLRDVFRRHLVSNLDRGQTAENAL